MASIEAYDAQSQKLSYETLRSLNTTCRTLAYKLREIHEQMESFAFEQSHDNVSKHFRSCQSMVQMILDNA